MSSHPGGPPFEAETVLEFDERSGAYVPPRRPFPWLPVVLFLATIGTTILTGGVAYSLMIVAILLTHEMGHYLFARYYGIPATLPYFIPFPFNFFGTMGAVIRMDGRWATRKQLFDIGIAGPLAGLVVAIPVALIGIARSQIVPDVPVAGQVMLGDSIIFRLFIFLMKGPMPEGSTLLLDPVALAGWVGLFVTALNLLPVGQLDGGHILYGLFGERSARISLFFLVGIGVFAMFQSPAYLLIVLLLAVFGYRHPPAREAAVGLDPFRRRLGFATLGFFLLAFTPVPIQF